MHFFRVPILVGFRIPRLAVDSLRTLLWGYKFRKRLAKINKTPVFVERSWNANKRHCCHYAEKESTQDRRNVLWLTTIHLPKKGWTCLNSFMVQKLYSSIFMNCQDFQMWGYGWIFPPRSSPFFVSLVCDCSFIPHVSWFSTQTEGKLIVTECCPCLPVQANGSKYWFFFSALPSEW